jgi:hypothetical protein
MIAVMAAPGFEWTRKTDPGPPSGTGFYANAGSRESSPASAFYNSARTSESSAEHLVKNAADRKKMHGSPAQDGDTTSAID